MKLLKLLSLLLFVTFMASCGKDDGDGDCLQSDWVGTYTGTSVCDGEDSEVATVTITASGTDAIIIEYETPGLTTTFDPITPNNCDINETGTQGEITLTVDGSLSGDEITFDDILASPAGTSTCTIKATRD